MGRAVIASVGFTKVGEHWDKGLEDLSYEAIKNLFKDLPSLELDAVYVGTALSAFYELQMSLASHIADLIGEFDVTVSNFEAGSASSAQALYNAILGVEAGIYKAALVGGVEKMSDELPHRVYRGTALVENSFIVDYSGSTELGLHALLAKIYLKEYRVERRVISFLPVLEHENASKARHAQFRNRISIEAVVNSPPIADPLSIFDVTAPGDGAAYLLVMDREYAESMGLEYIEVKGFGSASQPSHMLQRTSPLFFSASARAVEKAFDMAGLELQEIDLIEMYNQSSIAGLVLLESIGAADRGAAGELIEEGYFSLGGEKPINTFGGAKARGDPKGAVAAYQVAEAFLQLKGGAGDNQVENVENVLIHSMVGLDISAYAFVLGV